MVAEIEFRRGDKITQDTSRNKGIANTRTHSTNRGKNRIFSKKKVKKIDKFSTKMI